MTMLRDTLWVFYVPDVYNLSTNFRLQAAGSAEPSYVSKLVEGQTLSPEQEFEIKWSSASLYSGTWVW